MICGHCHWLRQQFYPKIKDKYMALFTEQQLLNRVRLQAVSGLGSVDNSRKANMLLSEARTFQNSIQGLRKTYDIFLSHSTNDAPKVAGLKLLLEDLGFSVYVDWIEDPLLDRSNVTKATAAILKARMQSCKSLFYAFSENSSGSKWMPWELGYFDGIKQRAAVLPIRASATSTNEFHGTEYLGLYHYITVQNNMNGEPKLWVRDSGNKYVVFDNWLAINEQPTQPK